MMRLILASGMIALMITFVAYQMYKTRWLRYQCPGLWPALWWRCLTHRDGGVVAVY